MDEWADLYRQQLEYEQMRLSRPDIVDSQETIAELARRDGVSVEQVKFFMPWLPKAELPRAIIIRIGDP